MDTEVIKLAIDKKFTEFSDSIKSELHSKLANNEVIANYTNEIDNIHVMKDKFAEINAPAQED